MKKLYLLFTLLIASSTIKAQVVVSARIDSLQLFVGEQTGITVDVTVNSKQRVELPVLSPGMTLVPNVEVIKALPADTNFLNDGQRMQILKKYIITAWDSALYYLPPMEVKVDGKSYASKNLALKVYTVDVDTIHVDRYFGPKAEMNPNFAWEDWKLIVWASLGVVLLAILAVYTLISLLTGAPIIRIRRKPKAPAHEIALKEIEKIKQERTWQTEDSKAYYTQLTDTLRTYIQDRYAFNAMEMTSSEIIDRLTAENDEEALNELRALFQTADLVKFAKHRTQMNENDANLMTALQYIEQTKKEPTPEEEKTVEEVTPEQKRSQRERASLFIATITFATLGLCVLAYIAWRVYDLMM